MSGKTLEKSNYGDVMSWIFLTMWDVTVSSNSIKIFLDDS